VAVAGPLRAFRTRPPFRFFELDCAGDSDGLLPPPWVPILRFPLFYPQHLSHRVIAPLQVDGAFTPLFSANTNPHSVLWYCIHLGA